MTAVEASLGRTYAACMLVLAGNYLYAQLLVEIAQTMNEFKSRETIQRANRIFVNVQENLPLHIGLLTGAMVVTSGSGLEGPLALAVVVYTSARTAWLVCFRHARDVQTARGFLSLLFGVSLLALAVSLLISLVAAFSR